MSDKPLKPYMVSYTIHAVVVAEDENQAYATALDERRDVLYEADEVAVQVEREVKAPADLYGKWDDQCIPYGGDGDTRIRDYL